MREIADGVGLSSTASIHYHVRVLAQENKVVFYPNISRGIVLVAQ
jgi:SOS-response transcriptional repressor LexA